MKRGFIPERDEPKKAAVRGLRLGLRAQIDGYASNAVAEFGRVRIVAFVFVVHVQIGYSPIEVVRLLVANLDDALAGVYVEHCAVETVEHGTVNELFERSICALQILVEFD